MSKVFSGLAIAAVLVSSVAAAQSIASRTEWSFPGGNEDQWQYSTIKQINDRNVGHLGVAWYADMPVVQGLVGNPLIMDGTVYQGAPGGRIIASDARTGKLLWTFVPKPLSREKTEHLTWVALWGNQVNRGLAIDRNHVYIVAGDCRLFAVDRGTGKQVWEAKPCDPTKDYALTGMPILGGGMIFIGNSSGELGTARGHVDAFDAATGRHLWRFYTVPGNPANGFESRTMEMASQTWPAGYWRYTGGGGPWFGMNYDEKLNRLYVGVGDPGPEGGTRKVEPGKNELFTQSIVALDVKTGQLIWYYQEVSGAVPCGCDANAAIQIADLRSAGNVRRVVMQASKDGFFYVIDAQSGSLISAINYVPPSWAYSRGGEGDGHTWTLMAYNPVTQLTYIPAAGQLVAWDPITQRERWHVADPFPLGGGILATAGNLVFQGTAGSFNAYAADTGKRLWTFDPHGTVLAAPATAQIDGEQLIVVPTGDGSADSITVAPSEYTTPSKEGPSRLLAFRLNGTVSLPPNPPVPKFPKPFRPPQPEALAKHGAQVFEESKCWACHGYGAEKAGTTVPDLRKVSREIYDAMPAIVLHGALVQAGMPAFPEITPSDLKAIQAFLTNQAWEGYNSTHQN